MGIQEHKSAQQAIPTSAGHLSLERIKSLSSIRPPNCRKLELAELSAEMRHGEKKNNLQVPVFPQKRYTTLSKLTSVLTAGATSRHVYREHITVRNG